MKPQQKNNARWFKASHIAGKTLCPICGAEVRIRSGTLWPVALIIPVLVGSYKLPTLFTDWALLSSILIIAGILLYTVNYEISNL